MAEEGWKVLLGTRDVLRFTYRAAYPLTIAKKLGYTRAEVQLALWYWQRNKAVVRRGDGRWYCKGVA